MKWKKSNIIAIGAVILTMVILISVIVLPNGTEEKELHMIYIAKIMEQDSDFYKLLMNGANMAAEEYHVQLTIMAPDSEEEYRKQNEMIEQAIAEHPDAILLSASNFTETTEVAKLVRAQGIKLVLIDSGIDESVEDTFVETNNIRAGEVLGGFMRELLTDSGAAAIVGHTRNSSTARDREEGIRRGFDCDEKIAEAVYCDSDYQKAYDLTTQMLHDNPSIELIAGTNEYAMVGAARAVRNLNLGRKIRVVGIDSSNEAIRLMEEGVIQAIVVQNPFKMGYMGVEAAVKTVNGEKVLPYIDTGSTLITRDNMYSEDNQKLLFLFDGE